MGRLCVSPCRCHFALNTTCGLGCSENYRAGAMAQSDDEDDYMNMTFEDAPKPQVETALQRAARKRKEVHIPTLRIPSP